MSHEENAAKAAGPTANRRLLAALAVALAITGAAGLALQVIWQRQLSLLFGNTVEATGAVLAAFLGSLAVGSAWIGRRADRVSNPLLLYGMLEALAGCGALLSLALAPVVGSLGAAAFRLTGGESASLTIVRCLLAVLLVAPATVPMGGTVAAIAAALARERRPAELLGLLYGSNTLGAAAGAVVAAFVLVLTLGLRGTWIAAGCSLLLVGIAVAATVRGREAPVSAPPPEPGGSPAPAASPRREALLLVGCVFVSGAVVLAWEVLWTRALVVHLGSHVATFALVLGIVLVALGAGGLVGGRLAEQTRDRRLVVGLLATAAAVSASMGFAALRGLPDFQGDLALRFEVGSYWGTVAIQALAVARVALVPSFLAGMILPVALGSTFARGRVGAAVGALVGASTAGTLLGSLASAFFLVPALGVGWAFVIVCAIEFALGALVLLAGRQRSVARVALVAIAGGALVMAFRSAAPVAEVLLGAGVFADGHTKVVAHEDGLHGLITVEDRFDGVAAYRSISVNGVNVAGTSRDLMTVQKLQAHIPLLVHGAARSVLHIGVGSGGTAASAALYPLERIDVVELNPRVPYLADVYFRDVNRGVLFRDPRIRIVYGDGRSVLLSSDRAYDVILSDSIHPRFAGNGSLYTRDYYELCRQRLAPGGIVSQWLPLYGLPPVAYRAIVRAFLDVFPDAVLWYPHDTFNANTILVGARDSLNLDAPTMQDVMSRGPIADDLAMIGIHSPADLLTHFVAGHDGLVALAGETPPHTDDVPLAEYASGRIHGEHYANYRAWTWRANFEAMLAIREHREESDGGRRSAFVQQTLLRYQAQLAREAP